MSDKNKTYCLINYGCQMNESDTEHYAGQLQELGYAPNPDFHTADIIIVNTCCVRESAEKKIAGKIGELKAVKRANPDVVICVAGCMAQKDGEKLRKKHPQVDLLLGTAYVNDFKRLLLEFLAERKAAVYTDLTIHQSEFEGHMVRQSSFAAWIPIMYGCNNFCTYCIVPYVRGRERSRSIDNIVAEIEAAVKDGYKEFTLLGQNVNSYGKDFGDKDAFAKLLRRVDIIPGVERIHYMTSHPRDMSEEVIKHPQSIVHSLVEFCDGSVIAQLGVPDMRLPIQFALSWPERYNYSFEQLDLVAAGNLTFEAPDLEAFPSLKIAIDCGKAGGTLPCAFNAANEEAVYAFLAGKIKYLDIPYITATVTAQHNNVLRPQLEDIEATDAWARAAAKGVIAKL